MKALVQKGYNGRASLFVDEIAMPEPKKGEVRVKVEACGVNASDWEFATGKPAYARIVGAFRSRPRVLGSDVLGVVDALGEGVDLEVGTRVLADTFETFGGMAEFCVAKAKRFVPVPAELDPVSVACLPQSGAIILDAFKGRVGEGTKVLINGGGGGCGPMATQYAKAMGAHVTAVDNAVKQTVMADAGADETRDYTRYDFAQSGQEWDVILDLYGTRPARDIDPVLAEGGRYMMVGGPVPTLINIAVAGMRKRKGGRHVGMLAVNQGPDHLPELIELLAAGTIAPVIGAVVDLDAAPDALARMGAGQIAGKLVIRP